jgi:hypothetical protein
VVLGQILLISYYFPKKLLERMRYVLKAYPPSDYPKLYPRPLEHYQVAHCRLELAFRIIFIVGLVVLFSIMFVIDHSTFAGDGYISEVFPAAYGVLQMSPLMVLELSEFGHLKMMRKLNESPTRKATLRRRTIADVVSPPLLVATLALIAFSIFFDLYAHDFNVSWSHDTAQRSITLLVTNALMFLVGAWQFYGRKLDPHQSPEDRIRRAAISIKSLLYVSMVMSVYFMTVSADDFYDLDALDAILMSLYFQAVVVISVGSVLRIIRPEEINFDVYKAT